MSGRRFCRSPRCCWEPSGLVSARVAVWAAFAVGLAALVVEGIVFARVERMGALGTIAIVTANLALGGALVGLKLLVNHF